ncbi:MAG: F0F1 ATP synthase subunit B [Arcobacteraceae bacterium]|jgi:F-type H+-transporting ATPase subunit b|nr:F0F1 ATP synthase subunit B [Arcobacteraceae bacterium]
MKKKWLFIVALFLPMILCASEDVQTDIVPRTVNFLIFIAIIYYLLADKLKTYFEDRSQSIQGQLDEVQKKLEESKRKMELARAELENAKHIANELVKDSMADVSTIKNKVAKSYENEMANLLKNYNDKVELETRKVRKAIVSEVLDELLNNENITITKDNLQNIILKKVA